VQQNKNNGDCSAIETTKSLKTDPPLAEKMLHYAADSRMEKK
jgi:hypothetical protein